MIRPKKIQVKFFRKEAGKEPVRDWLKSLAVEDRKAIGEEIKTVEFGWPVGMPIVKSIAGYPGMWEVRINIRDGIARILFTLKEGEMVLLHGIVKKSQKIPKKELDLAKKRMDEIG